MGDRTWIRITVLADQARELQDIVGQEMSVEDDDHGHPQLYDDQANYGWYTELEDCGHLVFEGMHGSGGEYGSCVFASAGEGTVWAACSSEGMPVAEVREDGSLDESMARAASDYWRVYRRARDMIERPRAITALERSINEERGSGS